MRRVLPTRRSRTSRWSPSIVVAVIVVVVGLTMGAAWAAGSRAADSAPPTPGSAASSSPLLAQLEAVPAGEADTTVPFDRDLFGQRWADVDRNGCDTRNDILRRDLTDLVVTAGTNGCKVLAGVLLDPYDGVTVRFLSGESTSQEVQIDHVVALAWAWRHGADTWTATERERFANDPLNLQATTAEANGAKSDAGPSAWLPSTAEGRCFFAEQYVVVLSGYDLTVGDADRAALAEVLDACD